MVYKMFRKNGQSTAEFAVLLALIAAALIAMQVYIRRGIQGRVKNLADEIGGQYEQGRTDATYETRQVSKTESIYKYGVSTTNTPVSWRDSSGVTHTGDESKRWGNETVTPEEATD